MSHVRGSPDELEVLHPFFEAKVVCLFSMWLYLHFLWQLYHNLEELSLQFAVLSVDNTNSMKNQKQYHCLNHEWTLYNIYGKEKEIAKSAVCTAVRSKSSVVANERMYVPNNLSYRQKKSISVFDMFFLISSGITPPTSHRNFWILRARSILNKQIHC